MYKPTRAAMVLTMGLVGLVGGTSLLAQVRGQATAADFLLDRGRVGQLELGMTVNAVYERIGKPNVQLVAAFGEGHFSPVLEIRLAGYTKGPALTALIGTRACGNDYSVDGLSIHDPRFRTRNGLGVGSTLGDLQRQYPSSAVGNIDKDGGPSVIVSELGLTFGMESQRTYTSASRVVSVWMPMVPLSEQEQRRLCADK